MVVYNCYYPSTQRQRLEDHEFEARLGHMANICLNEHSELKFTSSYF